jgi:hypothetical protein
VSAASGVVGGLAPFAAGAVLVGYAVATGLPAGAAVRLTVAVLVVQVLPGALCWRAVRPRNGWLVEDLAIGFAIGSVLAMGAQVVAGLSRVPALSAALPLGVGAVLLAVPVTRRRIAGASSGPVPWWWGVVVGVSSLTAFPQLVGYFSRNRPQWPPGVWVPHIDVYLHQAIAAQLRHRGPVSWPTVAGEDLGYHWFAHAWIAQSAVVSGTELEEVITRFMPALMPLVVSLVTATAALRLSGRAVTGAIAAALVMVGGHLNVFGKYSPGYPVEPMSPTLALGAPALVALVVVLALRWRGQLLSGAYVLVPLLAVAAAGTKGSTSPLVVAGLGVAVAAMAVWNRRLALPVLVDLAVVAGCLVLTVVAVFHGSSAGLALGLPEAAEQTAVGRWLGGVPTGPLQAMAIVVTVLWLLARSVAVYALPFFRGPRRDPLTWLLVGASLAGAAAVGVFSHPGVSQLYFALTAVPIMAIGSALGLVAIGDHLGRSAMTRLAVVGAVGGVLLAFLGVWLNGELMPGEVDKAWSMLSTGAAVVALGAVVGALAVRRRAPAAVGAATAVALVTLAGGVAVFTASSMEPVRTEWGPYERITALLATTQAQVDAARWIRDHSEVDDLVMTNRHCTTPREPVAGCDSRRWLVTAFSERQALVEGWTATPRATRIAPRGRDSITVDYWKPEILRLNDGFIAEPTADAAQRLRDLGVRWVYVDHTRPHAATLEPFASLRYSNRDADVYELVP